MWKSTACVTTLPFEYTVSRSVPWLCPTIGNGQVFGPAASVNMWSIVVIRRHRLVGRGSRGEHGERERRDHDHACE